MWCKRYKGRNNWQMVQLSASQRLHTGLYGNYQQGWIASFRISVIKQSFSITKVISSLSQKCQEPCDNKHETPHLDKKVNSVEKGQGLVTSWCRSTLRYACVEQLAPKLLSQRHKEAPQCSNKVPSYSWHKIRATNQSESQGFFPFFQIIKLASHFQKIEPVMPCQNC